MRACMCVCARAGGGEGNRDLPYNFLNFPLVVLRNHVPNSKPKDLSRACIPFAVSFFKKEKNKFVCIFNRKGSRIIKTHLNIDYIYRQKRRQNNSDPV